MDKALQRKICLENRKSLSEETRKEFSLLICNRLLPYLKQGMIMSYLPYAQEVDISPVNTDQMAYPVIKEDGIMEAYLPQTASYLRNRYHILEPDIASSRKIEADKIDIIVVPIVGFDENLNRLGHGKGYYDRFLSKTKARKIGVAFEIQKQDSIIHNSNDMPLDMIITERNIYIKRKQD